PSVPAAAVPAPAPTAPSPQGSAPPPLPSVTGQAVATRAPSEEPAKGTADQSLRIGQHTLDVLTSSTQVLLSGSRRREHHTRRRLLMVRELQTLHRLAEDLGPAGAELAARLGQTKDVAAALHREGKLLFNEEQRELTMLSEEVQSLRMAPLEVLFAQYPRMIRELARDLGKDVDLVLEGEDTKVDRSVLDALKEPLLHLVRNALDHGVETKDQRLARGKGPKGRLTLRARREGERLLLSVEDDGKGIDPQKLRESAVRKGLLGAEQASALPDLAAVDLIFQPGFSSKDEVTDVSGRGVGLDVVRVKVTGLGGDVAVASTPGQGTTFEVRVPVSLTVAPLLFLEAGDERLCLQAANVASARRVGSTERTEIAGKAALRVDDEVLPFASLASLLAGAPERAANEGELVLVLKGRGQSAAVGVDRVLEERTQAVLPLRGLLGRSAHLAGATALADGTLAIVLSAAHLVAAAWGREARVAGFAAQAPAERKRRILVVDDSPLTRELVVGMLEAVGYEVVSAHDGAHALETLSAERVDMVVTDLEMPQVDGLELTRRLKGHPTLRSLPVVIVTTRGAEADRRRGMEAGADGYVTKGDLVRQDLVDVVARLLP
ncbi:MAG: response regulator, partial [Myxococcaceae bacterium]|nr:response regulator [Myxococcaceae bacterium]